eukprot:CAMPEP_0168624662 /NCGR_PEP_ID=MMETSP0449_2-20121227/9551_1 /TAXON_ID=1082188 /ORGANISM="Strombidium rassoulzadegani, Strain ras09" /LENGTH=69 /DNA_ID=CAMNT_0008666271 /DNA_START=130 /DNA_END=339 /DNA_ORIENTATION=+
MGSVYQLDLTPPPEQANDPDFIRFYTVDLRSVKRGKDGIKYGRLILGKEADRYDLKIVPKADVVFLTSE